MAEGVNNKEQPAGERLDYAEEGPPIYRDLTAVWIKGGQVYGQSPPVVSCCFQSDYVNGDTATGGSYIFMMTGSPPSVAIMGTYEDEFRRTPEGWRFNSRVFHPDRAPS